MSGQATSPDQERPPQAHPGQIRGRRSARLAADRHRRRVRRRWLLVAGGLLLAVVVAALVVSRLGEEAEPTAADDALPVAGEDGFTLLFVRETDDGVVQGVTLLAGGTDNGPALVLFLPVGTLVDIPGVGNDRLGSAHQYGGPALLQASVENLLGVAVDHLATVGGSGLAAFLDRLDALPVDVPERLVTYHDDGGAEVRFEAGQQFLDGARLAEYWSFRARGEDELATLPRQQRVLEALLAAAESAGAVTDLVGDGAPPLDTAADAEWLEELFRRLSVAQAAGRLRFTLLPVEPFGGDAPDGGPTYRVRQAAFDDLLEGVIAATVPGEHGSPVRVQVLNGVGVPGIGQHVDRRLDRGRFRVVVTDNARDFDFEETQILVYEESDTAMTAARQVRDQLGVGTIQVSRQPQSVVDLTIVVGADFVSSMDPADEHSP